MSRGTLQPYIGHNTNALTQRTPAMTTKLLTSLLMAALFASSAAFAADSAIQVSMVEGKQQAQFKVGDARCVLVDDQIRCTLAQ
jgi:hypothetical protein